jgi:hypothetical protein
MSSTIVRSRHVIKRHSMRFGAALLAALASFVAGPNAACLRHPSIMIRRRASTD